jgi:hypothetical protein
VDLTPELKAMAAVENALKDLDEEERRRTVQWIVSRFRPTKSAAPSISFWDSNIADRPQPIEASAYADLASFYDAARPTTEADSALVATYWFQMKEGSDDVDAQRINSELKHLGRGIGNITRAFESLKSQKPALIVQTRKEGSTKQARKRYKVTVEGGRAVERMISRPTE